MNDDLERGMVYLGVIKNESQKIIGMQEIFLLHIPNGNTKQHIWYPDRFATFAFQPPKWDRDLSDKYFAVSGVCVDETYRKRGLATRMLNASIEIVKEHGARGVYGDPNYLNIVSQRVISKYFDIIGFTDGITSGTENEQSIYITYYHSFFDNLPPSNVFDVNIEGYPLIEARNILLNRFLAIGKLSKYDLAYKDGKNVVYVLDDCIVRALCKEVPSRKI